MILETPRLILRELCPGDFDGLCRILQDGEVMYAYEGPFSDREVHDWLENQLRRYREDGVGLWAAELRETGELAGQCGLTKQRWRDETRLEVGYLFKKAFWHRGYATEAALACRDYAFDVLGAQSVCSIIRDTNTASRNVALRNGMTPRDTWVKHYRGVDMPHILYSITRDERRAPPAQPTLWA